MRMRTSEMAVLSPEGIDLWNFLHNISQYKSQLKGTVA